MTVKNMIKWLRSFDQDEEVSFLVLDMQREETSKAVGIMAQDTPCFLVWIQETRDMNRAAIELSRKIERIVGGKKK